MAAKAERVLVKELIDAALRLETVVKVKLKDDKYLVNLLENDFRRAVRNAITAFETNKLK